MSKKSSYSVTLRVYRGSKRLTTVVIQLHRPLTMVDARLLHLAEKAINALPLLLGYVVAFDTSLSFEPKKRTRVR